MSTLESRSRVSPTDQRGVVALSGYGLRIAVERGHLILEDGVADKRRRRRFSRVAPNVQRVVILGHTGTVSLDAIRWLRDVGISLIQIDADGALLLATGTLGNRDARLRRAQARAQDTPIGLVIARELIGLKIKGQADVLERRLGAREHAAALREGLPHLERAHSVERVRYVEARASMVYWGCWENVPVHFAEREQRRVPAHWLSFGTRRSPLTARNQKAANPANAILNYLATIGEAEARIALMREGLDPGLGVIHVDRPERDNLALDLLEVARPTIETYVLDVLREKTFRRTDFFEARDGHCRLLPPLSEQLAETAERWAEVLGPAARRVARMLERVGATGGSSGERTAKVAQDVQPLPELLRNPAQRPVTRDPRWRPPKQRVCRLCGIEFEHAKNLYCEACIPLLPKIQSERAVEALRERQAAGDPNASPERRRKLAHARTENAKAIRAWEAAHPVRPTPHVFMETIWPKLEGVTAQAVREATGLSISYCRRVLRGQYVPHPMHWDALHSLVKARRAERDRPMH